MLKGKTAYELICGILYVGNKYFPFQNVAKERMVTEEVGCRVEIYEKGTLNNPRIMIVLQEVVTS